MVDIQQKFYDEKALVINPTELDPGYNFKNKFIFILF